MTTASKIPLVRVAMIPAYMVTMYLSGGMTGMWMFVSLGIKANNGKQTEHCDLQCFFHLFSPGVKNYYCQPPPSAVYKEISLT